MSGSNFHLNWDTIISCMPIIQTRMTVITVLKFFFWVGKQEPVLISITSLDRFSGWGGVGFTLSWGKWRWWWWWCRCRWGRYRSWCRWRRIRCPWCWGCERRYSSDFSSASIGSTDWGLINKGLGERVSRRKNGSIHAPSAWTSDRAFPKAGFVASESAAMSAPLATKLTDSASSRRWQQQCARHQRSGA